jgi:hypothetical protein
MIEIPKTCFIIQAFDAGKYDKRYQEVYKDAVEASNLKPIRADEVLGIQPIIETIEEQISECDAILADISESNENVFLELGYALAKNKPCVIICDREARDVLPFDIRHRPVIFYDSHSPSSFNKLAQKITLTLKEELQKENRVNRSNVKTKEGNEIIEDYENTVIGIILESSYSHPDGISTYLISRDFENFNYTKTTLAVAIESLKHKNLLEPLKLYDDQVDEWYIAYKLTDDGTRYVLNRRDIFAPKTRS